MLLFILYEGQRYPYEIADGETVQSLKERIRRQFQIQNNDQIENTVLNLSFAGSDLQVRATTYLLVRQRLAVKPLILLHS